MLKLEPRRADACVGPTNGVAMKRSDWRLDRWYLGVGLLSCVVYLAMPKSVAKEALYTAVAIGMLLAGMYGYVRDRPKPAGPWKVLIAGFGVMAVSEVAFFALITVGCRPEVENYVNLGYLAAYLVQLVGMVGLVRARSAGNNSASNWLDAAVVGIGAGTVLWSTLYDSVTGQQATTPIELVYQLGSPILGVAMIMMASRLVLGERNLRTGFGLLLGAFIIQTSTDVTTNLLETYVAGGAGDALWAVAYVLSGTALLHPSRLVTPQQRPTLKAREEANQALAVQAVVALAVLFAVGLRIAKLVPTPTLLVWGGAGLALTAINRARRFSLVRMVSDASASENQQQVAALVENSKEIVGIANADGTVRYVSPAVGAITGIAAEAWVGKSFETAIKPLVPEIAQLFQRVVLLGQGEQAVWQGQLHPVNHAPARTGTISIVNHIDTTEINGWVITARDITDEANFTSRLQHQALHDALTNLPNRALLFDRIAHALNRSDRLSSTVTCVALVDLDDFKAVNDSLGHDKGDELLKGIAARFVSVLRPGDTVARLGGDEFAILLEETEQELAMDVVQRIGESLAVPLKVGGTDLAVSASIGMVCHRGPGDPVELLRAADIAMYEAKRDGKSRVKVFEAQMLQTASEQLAMRVDLSAAMALDQLTLHYQPIVTTVEREIVGVEVLLRWDHPTRGSVPPAEFISIAEQTGLISSIGEWVLRKACFEAATWRLHDLAPYISVNASAAQISDRRFVRAVISALQDSRLAPERLLLEITETMLLDNNEQVRSTVDELRALGIRIAIDDFGTGYSSLAYLHQLAIDVVKIDQSFVRDIDTDQDHQALTKTMLALADGLGMTSIAEGVETEEELYELVHLGCQLAQGFLFSKPVPAEELVAQFASVTAST
jgi:diguanylate cyclase (GGDEF)-like protein/PAS domain S-box-containing protein